MTVSEPPPPPAGEATESQALPGLDNFRQLLEQNDFAAGEELERLTSTLMAALGSERFEALRRAVSELDYQRALQLTPVTQPPSEK